MPIRQEPTVVIREDQVIKLRLASRSHAIETCQPAPSPAVYITGSSEGLCIDTVDPLCKTSSTPFLVTGNVVSEYPGQTVYGSLLKNVRGLSIKARLVAFAMCGALVRALTILGLLLKAIGTGLATLILAADDLMTIGYKAAVLPFTSFYFLSFSVGALRLYQSGQTIELEKPLIVLSVHIAYRFSATAVNMSSELVGWLGYRRLVGYT